MEAPDSVPGTPRGGEPRRPLRLHQARLPAAPSAGGPGLIVRVPQGPGELCQAGFHALLAGPCRRALPASIPPPPRSVPAPRHYFSRCLSLPLFRILLPPRRPFCHGCGSTPGPKDHPPHHPTSARALAPAGAAQNTVGKSLWPGFWLSRSS